jgi:hypothetical protein
VHWRVHAAQFVHPPYFNPIRNSHGVIVAPVPVLLFLPQRTQRSQRATSKCFVL